MKLGSPWFWNFGSLSRCPGMDGGVVGRYFLGKGGRGMGCRGSMEIGVWMGYSRRSLLRPSAASGAPLSSHTIEGSHHKEQEAHADSHGQDCHSSLGSLGGHCKEG